MNIYTMKSDPNEAEIAVTVGEGTTQFPLLVTPKIKVVWTSDELHDIAELITKKPNVLTFLCSDANTIGRRNRSRIRLVFGISTNEFDENGYNLLRSNLKKILSMFPYVEICIENDKDLTTNVDFVRKMNLNRLGTCLNTGKALRYSPDTDLADMFSMNAGVLRLVYAANRKNKPFKPGSKKLKEIRQLCTDNIPLLIRE